MRSFGNRIFFILFVFSIFGASLFISRNFAVYRFSSDRSFSSSQVNVTEEALLERLAVSFPDIIVQLSKLNPEQQKRLIEQVRRDMVAVAFANGQSNEQAQKLGRIIVLILSKAIAHPCIIESYF
ncbi:hypothetical protein [Bartonella raoultii]|uniref:hypothetical protein n=1 Tax=Bartonella raoultii TaxID=1457020 RepID=UPI001ABAFEBF|nr:hypothetical protein [Bartonella raoultii]